MNLQVKEIVSRWLTKRGYDGLYNESGECGCGMDEMMECPMETSGECEPAYEFRCEDCIREGCGKRNEQACVIYSPDKDFCKPINPPRLGA